MELLKKYFKIYNEGKRNLNNNKEVAFDYFKESLEILSELRTNHLEKVIKYKDLIDKTENNSNKYITLTIESSIESEINNTDNIDINILHKNLEIGNIDIFKTIKCNNINFKEFINNTGGQTILHCAINVGDTTFLKRLFKLGARVDTVNLAGNTLLEYACIQQDPNIINFLASHGANMHKHLHFRDGSMKYISYNDSIDINILLKYILSYINEKNTGSNNKINNKIRYIKNNINLQEKINV
jgi:ankyrin repeat protein